MEYWVSRLREQAGQIISGDYIGEAGAFTQAPSGMAELSSDLDCLAQMIAEREATRNALALEVHHRVKNNLQIVTSLLNMQASRIEHPATREALGQTRARIGALALIHRILYEQADEGSQSTLDIARLVRELCAQFRLWNCNRAEIALLCDASACVVPLDTAMPLALFAVEAVSNAYAYAFPHGRGGTVQLHFGVTGDGAAVLSVNDDGVGFDSAGMGPSMGRQLMQGFADQLKGSFAIISSSGAGTQVRLDYRVAMPEPPA